ncbi:hypothetical protein OPT61_g5162 [Boeremia exigua]|uniref:Uncharacterized protein n=1 Tax=Boeremia exigua TaxID=749465 RepID=A0ACC2IBF9_9PLEO|nr:hypothetical protein OPT61_g5162 [Boeremia exigua]
MEMDVSWQVGAAVLATIMFLAPSSSVAVAPGDQATLGLNLATGPREVRLGIQQWHTATVAVMSLRQSSTSATVV